MNDKRPGVRYGLVGILMGLVLLLGIGLLSSSASASAPAQPSAPAGDTYVVNTTADDDDGSCDPLPTGPAPGGAAPSGEEKADCTLREAINASNADEGGAAINFAIPEEGPHTIAVSAPLPVITDTVTIDGYSESLDETTPASENTLAVGDNANILIQIDGSSLPRDTAPNQPNLIITGDPEAPGLAFQPAISTTVQGGGSAPSGNLITSSNSVVQGLSITNFPGDGIRIGPNPNDDPLVGPTGVIVRGNFIGIAAGSDIGTLLCGEEGNDSDGVEINAPENFVGDDDITGGTDPGARNVIACNDDDGVSIVSDDIDRQGVLYEYAVLSGTGNVVRGNYIIGNDGDGVGVASDGNVIGGTGSGSALSFEGTGNVITENGDDGVDLHDPQLDYENGDPVVVSGTLIQANLIGLDPTGTFGPGNGDDGVDVNGPDNVIGGLEPGAGNVISGHDSESSDGVEIEDGGSTGLVAGNLIQGNWIGTNISGTMALPNTTGVRIYNSAYDNLVGGVEEGAGNTISGNSLYGVYIEGIGTVSNTLQGNLIGVATTITGTTIPLGNGSAGVVVTLDASGTLIGGSVDSAALGSDESACTGPCNVISANGSGSLQWAPDRNAPNGNSVFDGAGVVFGDETPTPSPSTEPNANSAQAPSGSPTPFARNLVQGNFIGTDPTGLISDPDPEVWGDEFGNNEDGVRILESPFSVGKYDESYVTIGGPDDAQGNLISGNFDDGVEIRQLDCYECNAPSPGGFEELPDVKHIIQNNYIGTDVTGQAALGNSDNGVEFYRSYFNLIGGTNGEGNLISGNGSVYTVQFAAPEGVGSCVFPGVCGNGIAIEGANTFNSSEPTGFFSNLIQGNYIGTDVDGTEPLGNALNGVYLETVDYTMVGGNEDGAGNLISGNGSIVTPEPSPTGTSVPALPAGAGTATPTAIVVGNGVMLDYGTQSCCNNFNYGNRIQGNLIGTDVSGTEALGNADDGVQVNPQQFFSCCGPTGNGAGGASSADPNAVTGCCANAPNEVGGSSEAARNIISGNGGDGVHIGSLGDLQLSKAPSRMSSAPEGGGTPCCYVVWNNYIGTDISGEEPLGNGAHGVYVNRAPNISGSIYVGGALGLGNVIAYNTLDGVAVADEPFEEIIRAPEGGGGFTCCVSILTNSIFSNGDLGIDLNNDGVTPNDAGDVDQGPNDLANYPEIYTVENANGVTTVTGRLDAKGDTNYTIEFFANDECDPSGNGEGAYFLGQIIVDTAANGRVDFEAVLEQEILEGQFLTATATDENSGETSEFTPCYLYSVEPEPLPTATPCPIQFIDVPPSTAPSSFYTYIRCLACRGIVSGYPDGTFRPSANITRQQLAKIASNAAGFDEVIPTSRQTFADVPYSTSPSSFWVYIERLYSKGAVDGYACGSDFNNDNIIDEPCDAENRNYYRPGANVTRGQAAKIISESAEFFEDVSPAQQTYQDVPPSGDGSTFWVFIERLSMRGVMGGYPCGTGPAGGCGSGNKPYFLPGDLLTRGQASKIVANTFFPNCQTPVRP